MKGTRSRSQPEGWNNVAVSRASAPKTTPWSLGRRRVIGGVTGALALAASGLGLAAPSGAASGTSSLRPGEQLRVNQRLVSADGRFRVVMQADGNLVEYIGARSLWASGTAGSGATRVLFRADGNIVLLNSTKVVWSTKSAGSRATQLLLQNDANLVLYSSAGAKWASHTINDRVATGEVLRGGQQIRSQDGRYLLVMQGDGNLVQYGPNGALWATGTAGNPGSRVAVQGDGNVVVYGPSRALWASNTAGTPANTLLAQNDGNLVLYGAGRAWWSSRGASSGLRGDDYPTYLAKAAKDALVDPWRFYNRECTSFVAWRMNSANGIAFSNVMKGPNGKTGQFGNANHWDDNARTIGFTVNNQPAVGAIAQSDKGSGHVAWVSAVGNGIITIEEYNYDYTGRYSQRTVATSSYQYIHIRDL